MVDRLVNVNLHPRSYANVNRESNFPPFAKLVYSRQWIFLVARLLRN